MGSSKEGEVVVGKEEVITKLKDDGDFDRLRLKIIRKLKDNVCFTPNFLFISYYKFMLFLM